jgi:hypothetical protein
MASWKITVLNKNTMLLEKTKSLCYSAKNQEDYSMHKMQAGHPRCLSLLSSGVAHSGFEV